METRHQFHPLTLEEGQKPFLKEAEHQTLNNIYQIYRQQPDLALRTIQKERKDENFTQGTCYDALLLYLEGVSHSTKGQFNLAKNSLARAIQVGSQAEIPPYQLALCNNQLGVALANSGRVAEALDYFFSGIKLGIDKLNPTFYNNLGLLYQKQEDQVGKAMEYLEKGYSLALKNGNPRQKISCLINMGNNYYIKADFKSAIEHYEMVIKEIETMPSGWFDSQKARSLVNMGTSWRELKDLDKMEECFKDALKIADVQDTELLKVNIWLTILSSYNDLKMFEETLKHCTEVLRLARSVGHQEIELEILGYQITAMENLQTPLEEILKLKNQSIALLQELLKGEKEGFFKSIVERQEEEFKTLEDKSAEVEKKNLLLQQNNKELEQYAYIVAHDLREPLRNISSFASLLKKKYSEKLDDKADEYINFVVSSASHMDALLVDLLRYATIEKVAPEPERVDVSGLLVELQKVLKEKLNNSGIELQVEDMPILDINPQYLNMIFQNLVQNAAKFYDPEKAEPKIVVSHKETDEEHVFSVWDNGIGIKEEHLAKIFKIFNSLDRSNYEGTGIGLAICEKISQLYAGRVWVESEFGQWTQFSFSLGKENTSLEQTP